MLNKKNNKSLDYWVVMHSAGKTLRIQKNSTSAIRVVDILGTLMHGTDESAGLLIKNCGNGIFMAVSGNLEFWRIKIEMVDKVDNGEYEIV